MEIKKKVQKEVEEIVGYKCDVCKNPIEIDLFFKNLRLNTVKYSVPNGGWGERTDNVVEHICSVDCLKKSLRNVAYGANVFLSRELIEELIQSINIKQEE